jgi:hypothetical protein
MKKCLLILTLFASIQSYSQTTAVVEWYNALHLPQDLPYTFFTYGNGQIITYPLSDGGFIIASLNKAATAYLVNAETGETYNNLRPDILLLKVNAEGNIIWQQSIDNGGYDLIDCIKETENGEILISGGSEIQFSKWIEESIDWYGNTIGGEYYGYYEYKGFLAKLSHDGNIIWSKPSSANHLNDELPSKITNINSTSDGGVIVAGYFYYHDKDAEHTGTDLWIGKFSGSGEKEWEKKFARANNAEPYPIDIFQTKDLGYIITFNRSTYESVYDEAIVKLDMQGKLLWVKHYDGLFPNYSNNYQDCILESQDGNGYLITGKDQTGNSCIYKIDVNGDLLWKKNYTGIGNYAFLWNIVSLGNNGYVVAGVTDGENVEGHLGDMDVILLKIDEQGEKKWQKIIGGQGNDHLLLQKLNRLTDSTFIVSGFTDYSSNFWQYQGPSNYNYTYVNPLFIKLKETESKDKLEIISQKDPDKNGCATGEISFTFSSSEWSGLKATLYKVKDKGAEVIAETNLSFPDNTYTYKELKAGEYYITARETKGKTFRSGKVKLTDPEPGENNIDAIVVINPDNYDCKDGTLHIRYSTEDCFDELTVNLIKRTGATGGISVQEQKISRENNVAVFQNVKAGIYFANIYDGGNIKATSKDVELQNPPLECKNLSVSIKIDESQHRETCMDRAILTLNTAGTCPESWMATIGASKDGIVFSPDLVKPDQGKYSPDEPISIEILRIPQATINEKGIWYTRPIQVNYSDKVCEIKPQPVNNRPLAECKGNNSITKRILKHPGVSCNDGIVVFRLDNPDHCSMIVDYDDETAYLLEGLNGYSEQQNVKYDEPVTFDHLEPGKYQIRARFFMGLNSFCDAIDILDLTPVTDELLIYPNPITSATQNLSYHLSGCFNEPVEMHIRNLFGQTISRITLPPGSSEYSGHIPFNNIPSGIYSVLVFEGIKLLHQKTVLKL